MWPLVLLFWPKNQCDRCRLRVKCGASSNVLIRHLPRQHRNCCHGCPASKRNRLASEPPPGFRQLFHPTGRAGSGADPSGYSHRISKPTSSPQRSSRRGNAGAAPVARYPHCPTAASAHRQIQQDCRSRCSKAPSLLLPRSGEAGWGCAPPPETRSINPQTVQPPPQRRGPHAVPTQASRAPEKRSPPSGGSRLG